MINSSYVHQIIENSRVLVLLSILSGDGFATFRGAVILVKGPSWTLSSVIMSGKYIVSAILGSFGVAWVCDYYVSEKKLFGGTTPGTITNNEWAEETDKKLQAWPRTAGPPVVMNPISRQNFIVKSRPE
ncbi:hypothetical protein GmHk_19G055261 [Glycine max]|nr:hypothetical protein GmHk_19G055261 [Glycine max]